MMNNKKIFAQIASYRDPQLVPTIRSALENAKNPELLNFGVCWQKDENESLEEFENHPQVKYQTYHYSESHGLGWARSKVSELFDGEELTLQLDSHHRFAPNWDVMMLEDYNQALSMSKKPILSTYLTPFNVGEYEKNPNSLNPTPCLMSQYKFSDDKLLMSMPYYIQDHKDRNTVIKARTISGHFFLVDSSFISEVPYDPEIYFGGYCEETTMSLRAWTHGYDFFSPYRQYIWHEYTREGRPKHWDDHSTKSKTSKNSGERDVFARQKTRQLFGTEDNGITIEDRYGLGKDRTLEEYEIFGGFDFKKCRIHNYTLQVKEPPNPLPWEEGFQKYDLKKTITWDTEFFKKHNFPNPTALTLGIQDEHNEELYRIDFSENNYPELLRLEDNSYDVDIVTHGKAQKIVMYMVDPEMGWSDRYEDVIE